MYIYQKISDLIESKVTIKEEFYSKIGMTRIGFTNMMKNKSLKVETLEKIASYFELPVACFFDEEGEVKNEVKEMQGEYGYKQKYYDTLEQLNEALKEINELRKERDKSNKTNNPTIYKP